MQRKGEKRNLLMQMNDEQHSGAQNLARPFCPRLAFEAGTDPTGCLCYLFLVGVC